MTIDDAIAAMREAAELPGVPELVREAGADALAAVRDGWPVATGESLAGWSASVEGSSFTIENSAGHAEYVHGGAAAADAEADFLSAAAELADNIEQRTARALDLE